VISNPDLILPQQKVKVPKSWCAWRGGTWGLYLWNV